MPKTVKRTLTATIAFFLALVVLLFIGYLSRNTNTKKRDAEFANANDFRAIICLTEAWGFSQKAEAAYNGYIATGRPSLKEPYDSAMKNLDLRLAAAKELFKGDVSLRTLEDLYLQKNQLDGRMRELMQMRMEKGYVETLGALKESDTETFLEQLRGSIGDLIRYKRESLEAGFKQVSYYSNKQSAMLSLGNIFAFIFLCVSVWALTREMVDRGTVESSVDGIKDKLLEVREELEKERMKRNQAEEAGREMEMHNQQLTIKTKDLQDFANMASRDLKAPVQRICDTSRELVEYFEDELDEQGMGYLRDMAENAMRMDGLIKTLSEYSQINANLKPFTTVNLEQVLQSVEADLAPLIERTEAQMESEGLREIQADASQMAQLFFQLLSNAMKFYREDTAPKITVKARYQSQEWTMNSKKEPVEVVMLEIRDNGVGFNMRFKDRIFSPFETLGTWHNYKDPGMGLTIVKRIVERHHGAIRVESKVGSGSIFTIVLPVVQRTDFGTAKAY